MAETTTPLPEVGAKPAATATRAATSMRKEDNVGLAAEFAVAAYLTNAGWFAAMMPSSTFPGIDIMARKAGYEPVSVQVKASRKRGQFFVIDSSATRVNGAVPDVPAQIYVFGANEAPGFNSAWSFSVMTREEVRACMKCDAGGSYVPAAAVRDPANVDAWSKMALAARPIAETRACPMPSPSPRGLEGTST
ncbi:hypothetical protein [Neoroseomonas soli]|uniref:Uncharacterized protein n=1 Tax=Neoroseomonas soli TaxID=1081025 RepID=A0A9X9WVI0_9PROT|nr:hypothetical protein [Neoroseomonas soli]MBR0671159.1 hypothetical protein [Neoroseomonas soli]